MLPISCHPCPHPDHDGVVWHDVAVISFPMRPREGVHDIDDSPDAVARERIVMSARATGLNVLEPMCVRGLHDASSIIDALLLSRVIVIVLSSAALLEWTVPDCISLFVEPDESKRRELSEDAQLFLLCLEYAMMQQQRGTALVRKVTLDPDAFDRDFLLTLPSCYPVHKCSQKKSSIRGLRLTHSFPYWQR